MKLERLLRSKFWHSAAVTDAFQTLSITQPEGALREDRGIQLMFRGYPRGKESPRQTILLPANEAFEVARDVVRVHHRVESEVNDVDLVGLHAMSQTEFLMIEAVMTWADPNLRLAFWNAMGNPMRATILMEHFVSSNFVAEISRQPSTFEALARGELGC